jgi:AbiV family abortive infection protein
MKKPEEFTPAIEACLQNAERMVAAAKACAKPGSYHLAFHLATMALEEIGKSSMIFLDALDRKSALPGDENGSPLKWVEDHERKLFWAIWVPGRESLLDWHTIPAAMDFARGIHKDRLETLYVDPNNLSRSTISQQRAESIIAAAEARLNMERLKEFREMEPERQDLMTWFFLAMDNPRLKPMIFSKGSFDKQAEFGDDCRSVDEMAPRQLRGSRPQEHGVDQSRNAAKARRRRGRLGKQVRGQNPAEVGISFHTPESVQVLE